MRIDEECLSCPCAHKCTMDGVTTIKSRHEILALYYEFIPDPLRAHFAQGDDSVMQYMQAPMRSVGAYTQARSGIQLRGIRFAKEPALDTCIHVSIYKALSPHEPPFLTIPLCMTTALGFCMHEIPFDHFVDGHLPGHVDGYLVTVTPNANATLHYTTLTSSTYKPQTRFRILTHKPAHTSSDLALQRTMGIFVYMEWCAVSVAVDGRQFLDWTPAQTLLFGKPAMNGWRFVPLTAKRTWDWDTMDLQRFDKCTLTTSPDTDVYVATQGVLSWQDGTVRVS